MEEIFLSPVTEALIPIANSLKKKKGRKPTNTSCELHTSFFIFHALTIFGDRHV